MKYVYFLRYLDLEININILQYVITVSMGATILNTVDSRYLEGTL